MPVLPHSGLTVPNTGYAVTGLKQHGTHEGVAFTATLRRDKRIIGTVENSGTGGPTTFYPAEVGWTERTALEQYAEQSIDGDTGKPATVEAVLDALVAEYDMGRSVAKATKRGNTLLRLMEDLEDEPGQPLGWMTLAATTEAPTALTANRDRLRAHLQGTRSLAPHPLAWWQVWDGQRWADVTARPAHLSPETA